MMLSRAETKALYDKISKVYDRLSEHTEGPVREAGLRMLAPQPGETVLEIGFGTGHALVGLARAVGPSGKVHGIDLSDGMVALAEALVRHEGFADRVVLRPGDATDLPYPADSMDAVFMSFTLELFDTAEIPVVLAQCRRVIKTGGRIVVVGMSKEGRHGLVYEAYEWTHRHFPNFVDCRPIMVSQAVAAAGFHVTGKQNLQIWVPMEIVRAEKQASPGVGSVPRGNVSRGGLRGRRRPRACPTIT
jgi:demethylmenaquinone methyltransferase/2-methoxy-6-polyprenyl-1,4-benzoquinol methylase